MIKEKELNIKIVGRNLNKYRDLGYICNVGSEILVKIEDIPKQSHTKITATCDNCGKESNISIQKYNKNYNNQNIYTCKKCAQIKNKITSNERYGVDYPLKNKDIYNKLIQSNIKKYGVKNVFQLDEVKDKIKITNNKNLGVDYPQQNKDILEKSNKTNIIKYGFTRPAKNLSIQEKCKITKKEKYDDEFFNNITKINSTVLDKYNVTNISLIPGHKDKIRKKCKKNLYLKYLYIENIDYENSTYECKCKKDHIYKIDIGLFHNRLSHNINTCTICYPENSISSDKEMELLNFIKENYNGIIEVNDRIILNGKELDIYIPELKLAFEYNGLYWHSNIYKDDDYHLNKMNDCLDKNIQLIHIWEDDWIYNNELTKNNIIKLLNNDIVIDDIDDIDDNFITEIFYVNNKMLETYDIVDIYEPIKWNIIGNNRYEFNEKLKLPYIIDCGLVILKKKVNL